MHQSRALLLAFSLLALATGDADQSCSNGVEEASLLQVNKGSAVAVAADDNATASECGTPLQGKNNLGTNMPSSPGENFNGDAESCEQLCADAAGCLGWSFLQNTPHSGVQMKQCWLKDGNLSCPAEDNADEYNVYVSGFCRDSCEEAALLQVNKGTAVAAAAGDNATASECGTPLQGKNNFGTNMPSSPGEDYTGDAESCEQLCADAAGCLGWSFLQNTPHSGVQMKQCWLKDANVTCPAEDNTDEYNVYVSGFCRDSCA